MFLVSTMSLCDSSLLALLYSVKAGKLVCYSYLLSVLLLVCGWLIINYVLLCTL